MIINAKGVYYKELNEKIRELIKNGHKEIMLKNVNGQRYIGGGINGNGVRINIEGVPGNDLASFMNGPTIFVNTNAQDGVANTMNSGKIVVKGDAGDVLGYGMRGGKLFIRGNVGYRVGIHMKEYENCIPVIIAGGTARDFFGEYMAGGIMILLDLEGSDGQPIAGNFLGTGMHGGVIYLRGEVEQYQLGKEVGLFPLDDLDRQIILPLLKEYAVDMDLNMDFILEKDFQKLLPRSRRPYGSLYAY